MRPNHVVALVLVIGIAGCSNMHKTTGSNQQYQQPVKKTPTSAVAVSVASDSPTPVSSAISVATAPLPGKPDSSIFSPLTEQNIFDALKLLGVYSYNINIPLTQFGGYQFYVHLDEYVKDSLVRKRETQFAILPHPVNLATKENYIISLTVLDKNADEFVVDWKLPSGTQQTLTKKKDKKNSVDFNVIKFSTNHIIPGKKLPALLCGSSWYDSTYKVYRFCMERELSPDFSNEAFKQIPAYYVLSIELRKE